MRRDEHDPVAPAQVREWRVRHPSSGATHRFDLEDKALSFAADLAVCHGARRDGWAGKPVRVDYPTGAVVELSARIVRGASR